MRIYLNYLTHYDILKSEKNRMCKVYTKRNPLSTANTEGIFYIGIYSKSVSDSDTIIRFFSIYLFLFITKFCII